MPQKHDSSENPFLPSQTNTAPGSVAFIHNYLDEYGLDPYEFRLYAHIVRRTGGKTTGECFASLSKIAKICKMSPRRAQQAIKVLLASNLVKQNKRSGRTDIYQVQPSNTWFPREHLTTIRKAITDKQTEVTITLTDGSPYTINLKASTDAQNAHLSDDDEFQVHS